MDLLEKEHGWKDDEFDFVLQFLRTILLKRKQSEPQKTAVNVSCSNHLQTVHP
jgi:hypothetical protein